ncbi:uncharacterized protein METZ01_LOCUS114961 [marine metagenome]|uniref:Uncharacterized protein n=1 Tax=marine metagenome TaxID=408172 RepID=A0A381XD48_9ZZZZ
MRRIPEAISIRFFLTGDELVDPTLSVASTRPTDTGWQFLKAK